MKTITLLHSALSLHTLFLAKVLKYISELFECHRNTITEGKSELENREVKKFNDKAIQEKGGGRKSCFEQIRELDEEFLSVVKEATAGDPMEEKM